MTHTDELAVLLDGLDLPAGTPAASDLIPQTLMLRRACNADHHTVRCWLERKRNTILGHPRRTITVADAIRWGAQ